MASLSIKECLSFAWNTFKSRPWIFVQAGLVLFLVNIAASLVQSLLESGDDASGAVVTILAVLSTVIGMTVSFLVSMGETAFFLRAHDATAEVRLKDLWHPRPFWKFVGTSLLAGLIILIGLILLIVPGIIAGIMLMFVGYIVIEEKLGPIDALKKSVALTKGNRWKLFQLALLTIGLNVLGFLALLVGLFVTVPVSFLMAVHAYRTLSGTEKPSEEVVIVEPAAV